MYQGTNVLAPRFGPSIPGEAIYRYWHWQPHVVTRHYCWPEKPTVLVSRHSLRSTGKLNISLTVSILLCARSTKGVYVNQQARLQGSRPPNFTDLCPTPNTAGCLKKHRCPENRLRDTWTIVVKLCPNTNNRPQSEHLTPPAGKNTAMRGDRNTRNLYKPPPDNATRSAAAAASAAAPIAPRTAKRSTGAIKNKT